MDAEAVFSESSIESFEATPAPPPRSLTIVRTENERNGEHTMSSSPPRATEAAIREATHGMLLATTSFMKTMEAQAVQNSTATQTLSRAMEMMVQQQAQPKSRFNGLTTPLLTAGAIVVTVFGVQFIPASTSSMREDLRMANYKIEQNEKRESELRDRVQSNDYIMTNLQKSLSALGVEVDGKTGQVVAVRGRQVR